MSGPSRLESSIENAVLRYAVIQAQALGFPLLIRKMNGLGNRSWPDRLLIFKGRVVFIEFKRKGHKLTPLQADMFKKLGACDIPAFKVDSVDLGKKIIDMVFA
jgi:hypothetical protein